MNPRVALGVALLAIAVTALIARHPLTRALAGPGATAPQRALAGGTAGVNPRLSRPLRVVVLDGLSRADAPRLPALGALCDRGAALRVDVGFPTKSLAVQRALWSGLTAQQTGDGYDNEASAAPASSLPLLVFGAIAVVESHAVIARSVGFPTVFPAPEADGVDPLADPGKVAAWERGEFVATARAAVASESPLVLVHVLAIDEAAHRAGRTGDDYASALAAADAALAAVVDAAPDAQWLVLSDHGHVPDGGHGDAEDAVRRVLACLAPAPASVTGGGEVHLVDLARWLVDSSGAPRDPRAVGRALAVAIAHPDPDATLRRPTAFAWIAALVLLGLGLAAAVRGAPSWRCAITSAGWPVATAVVVLVVHGVPTLSHRAPTWLLAIGSAVPCCASLMCATWTSRAGARSALAVLAPILAIALGAAILSGVPAAILGGPPPRVPYWTGALGAAAVTAAVAIAATSAFLLGNEAFAAVRRVRSTGRPRPKHGH